MNFNQVCFRLGKGKKAQTVLSLKMKQMYDAIRDYREPKANRQLSSIFLKLPSKNVSINLNYNFALH